MQNRNIVNIKFKMQRTVILIEDEAYSIKCQPTP